MNGAVGLEPMVRDRNDRIAAVVTREHSRLRRFIRRRVPNPRDAEDVLQDVFATLAEANGLLVPIEHVAAWLFRVARNRIIDLFRKKSPEAFDDLEELLPPLEAGPDADYARELTLDALAAAIEELPQEQRDVFVAHEMEGRSFKELAAETGVNVNTLLSRKRYAVLYLRMRLQIFYDELTDE
jgi:RNA polymerase sigma factor (sigma-70 family)